MVETVTQIAHNRFGKNYYELPEKDKQAVLNIQLDQMNKSKPKENGKRSKRL